MPLSPAGVVGLSEEWEELGVLVEVEESGVLKESAGRGFWVRDVLWPEASPSLGAAGVAVCALTETGNSGRVDESSMKRDFDRPPRVRVRRRGFFG